MDYKLKIVREIAYVYEGNYEYLLEYIYQNRYRLLDKVPPEMFFMGIVERFKFEDLESMNQILRLIKEVVEECLQLSGIELTFVDDDWKNLEIIKGKYKGFALNNKEKSYLGEFYE